MEEQQFKIDTASVAGLPTTVLVGNKYYVYLKGYKGMPDGVYTVKLDLRTKLGKQTRKRLLDSE